MTIRYRVILSLIWLIASVPLFGQIEENCFLKNFEPKYATIPPYKDIVDKVNADL
jgi:hypothetical protein